MSDIFIALPKSTQNDCVIFAKNSDRPPQEVHEICYVKGGDHPEGSKLKCTWIEINQCQKTYDVILSKPSWSWGAEMGANIHGVCVGCTSVWTKMCHSGDHEEKLLGVDFVRLALERAANAKEGISVITALLETYGQGGPTCDDPNFGQWSYNNSFVVVDNTEAWVLDTAGRMWVSKKMTSGIHNISSELSLTTDYDMSSANLQVAAETVGCWKASDGPVNFKEAFSAEFGGLSLSENQKACNRYKMGQKLMEEKSKEGKMNLKTFCEILRDEKSSINFCGELLTVSSQISILPLPDANIPACHWFTGTPNTSVSVFKPFLFTPEVDIGNLTVCRNTNEKKHALYIAHEKRRVELESISGEGHKMQELLRELEFQCMTDLQNCLNSFSEDFLPELSDLMKDVVETEYKFYN